MPVPPGLRARARSPAAPTVRSSTARRTQGPAAATPVAEDRESRPDPPGQATQDCPGRSPDQGHVPLARRERQELAGDVVAAG